MHAFNVLKRVVEFQAQMSLHAGWDRWEEPNEENMKSVAPFQFTGHPGIRGLGRAKQLTPYDIFNKLFPGSLVERIVEETNKYAMECGAGEVGRGWKDVDRGEILLWHGLVFAMALHPLPALEDYWKTGSKGAVVYPGFSSCGMSLKRFEQIKRYLHMNDSRMRATLDRGSREYRLWHVLPVIETLTETFQQFYYPNRKVTIDERTIPIRNRQCPVRMYTPKKPYKFGVQVHTICDSVTYYCWGFRVYDKVKTPDLHAKVVLEFMETLRATGHEVFLDRGFTAPMLLHNLKGRGHTATGTCMANRKGFPTRELSFLKKEEKKGAMKALVDEQEGMVAVAWVDKRPVLFLSTMHGVGLEEVARRNGAEVDMVACPELAREYNKYKDAVDQYDKLCLKTCYSLEVEMIARKWWHRLYWGLFDGAIQNAWILYDIIQEGGGLDHFSFQMLLQEQLVFNPYVQAKKTPRMVTVAPQRAGNRLDLSLRHFSVHAAKKSYCVVCVARAATGVGDKRGSQTRYTCTACTGVPLCIGACFIDFHTLPEIPNLKLPPGCGLLSL